MLRMSKTLLSLPILLILAGTARTEQFACSEVICGDKIVLKGKVDVIDGDTIWLGIHKVRLFGIEALETDQTCIKNGKRWRCADRARGHLNDLVQNHSTECIIDRGKFGRPVMDRNRYLGTCYVNGKDINADMVTNGWALAIQGDQGEVYRSLETAAKDRNLGIHQTTFQSPAEYRKSQRSELKPLSCPAGATAQCVPKS